eukprot:9487472-Pyramimonas_sp.AAC.1
MWVFGGLEREHIAELKILKRHPKTRGHPATPRQSQRSSARRYYRGPFARRALDEYFTTEHPTICNFSSMESTRTHMCAPLSLERLQR